MIIINNNCDKSVVKQTLFLLLHLLPLVVHKTTHTLEGCGLVNNKIQIIAIHFIIIFESNTIFMYG